MTSTLLDGTGHDQRKNAAMDSFSVGYRANVLLLQTDVPLPFQLVLIS